MERPYFGEQLKYFIANTIILRVNFFKRQGERKEIVQFKGVYANTVENGSLSKLDDRSSLTGRHVG